MSGFASLAILFGFVLGANLELLSSGVDFASGPREHPC